jgi:hypothetical protein
MHRPQRASVAQVLLALCIDAGDAASRLISTGTLSVHYLGLLRVLLAYWSDCLSTMPMR